MRFGQICPPDALLPHCYSTVPSAHACLAKGFRCTERTFQPYSYPSPSPPPYVPVRVCQSIKISYPISTSIRRRRCGVLTLPHSTCPTIYPSSCFPFFQLPSPTDGKPMENESSTAKVFPTQKGTSHIARGSSFACFFIPVFLVATTFSMARKFVIKTHISQARLSMCV